MGRVTIHLLTWTLLALTALGFAQEPSFSAREARYRLQPEDKIEVQYRYTPEYNAVVSIQPDGFVSLPLTGDLPLAGLTLGDAQKAIEAKAAARLRDPEVIVLLREYVKPYFVVAGEVTHPGRFDLRGTVSVVEAIAQSGGLKETSKYSQVVLLRRVDAERAQTRLLDLRHLMSARGIQEDPQLQSGDVLVVPRTAISKLEPYVRVTTMGLSSVMAGLLWGLR